MRNNKDNRPYLEDILQAISAIETYMQDAPEKEEFIQSSGLYQDAVLRNIIVIGEAAKKVSDELKSEFPNIPWKQIAGMRDKVTHDYAEIDWEEVWKVAKEDVQTLRDYIETVLLAINQREG